MPEGQKTFVITFIHDGSYTSNVNNITFTEISNIPNVVDLPPSGTLDLNKATLANQGSKGCVAVMNGVPQFDSMAPGSTAAFNLNNTKDGASYILSFGAATGNDGNQINLQIIDLATGEEELNKTFDITNAGWQEFNTYKTVVNNMSAGLKSFVISFIHDGYYTSNVNNVTFSEGDIELPAAEPLDPSKATLTSGTVKDVDGVKQFDSVNPGSTATFNLNNTKDGASYILSFGAATGNDGNQINLQIIDLATGEEELNKTFDITKAGWQTFNTYKTVVNNMSAGLKSFVISFIHDGPYTSNVNNVTFSEGDIELPAAEPLDPSKATLTSGTVKDVDGVKQFDSVNPGSTATFNLNNTKDDASYILSFGAATGNDGNQINLQIIDLATGEEELNKTFDITNAGWQAFNTYKTVINNMSAGLKSFVISFIHDGYYTSNVNNIKFIDANAKYSLSVKVNPADAGEITISPSNGPFDHDTEVTLSQQANAGYTFVNWTDANGNEITAADDYTFNITANTEIVANYEVNASVNIIPNSATNPFDMRKGELHGSSARFGDDNHIDYMYNGDYAIYKLETDVDAIFYDIDFGVGTEKDNVSLTFAIENEAGETVWSGKREIENNGEWGDYKPYSLRTGEIPRGKYTMKITFNSVGGNGTTGNLNNINFTARQMSEAVDNQTATITYVFDQGTENQTGAYSENAKNWFVNNCSRYGADLELKGARLSQTLFQPINNNEAGPTDKNYIDFMFATVNGLTFTPTKVSFNTSKFGTNGGKIDATWVNSDGTTVVIEQGITPERNDTVLAYSKEVTGAAASDGVCGLRLNIYSLGNSKQVGVGNIVIEGIVNGQVAEVSKSVEIGSAGVGTLYSHYNLDFANAQKIAAYKAEIGEGVINLSRVNTVAAREGVLIRSIDGTAVTEDIPVVKTAFAVNEGNSFIGTLVDIASQPSEDTEYRYYILSSKTVGGNKVYGFYLANNKKIAAGKAYLRVPLAAAAKYSFFSFDDETTGIEDNYESGIADTDAPVYDLSGRKVVNPATGLYIKNGKKFIVK